MNLKKTVLNTAVAAALTGAMVAPAQAAVLDFTFEGLFTMVNSGGAPTQNTSYPYYGDTTWGYGKRTQITGTMQLDTDTGAGTGTVNSFDFFAQGPAVPHDITMQAVGDGAGGPGTLIIGNMLFDWNNNNDIAVEIVLDAAGLFGALDAGMAPGDTVTGTGAIPATDGMKGNLPIGPVPVATTTLDTDGVSITGDDGIGGSTMDNGPFIGFNANFDMTSVTFVGCSANCEPPAEIPVPAAVWLFGSGLVGLAGVARRRKQS